MTESRNFKQIEDDKKSRFSEGDKQHPLVISCLKKYCSAIDGEKKNFAQIDECRNFVDSNLIELVKDIGGQEMLPIIRKLSEGYEHPDGSPKSTSKIGGDVLVNYENLTRHEIKREKINKQWKRETKGISSDGALIQRIDIDKRGFPKTIFIDRKSVIFDENAEDIHHEDEAKSAVWSFETETLPFSDAKAKYKKLYPRVAERMVEGNPYDYAQELTENQSQKDAIQKELVETNGDVKILHVKCLKAPIDAKYRVNGETIEIKQGEPFEVKIAGGSCLILDVKSGEDYSFFWADTKEPYLPYIPYYQMPIRKGLQCPSIISVTMPYFLKIIFYNALLDNNTELLAKPIFAGKFSGKKGNEAKNFFRHNLKQAAKGEKITNFYLVDGEDLDVEWEKMTPDKLDIQAIIGYLERLEKKVVDIIGIIIDDTVFNPNERVGVRQFREQAQRGAISFFQTLNSSSFELLNKMIANTLLTITPKYTGEQVEIEGSIRDPKTGKPFTYTEDLDVVRESLTPEILKIEWKFAHSLPSGAVSAAADGESKEVLAEAKKFFPQNRQINRAYLSFVGKIVNSVSGTDSLNVEEAIREEEEMALMPGMEDMPSGNGNSKLPPMINPQLLNKLPPKEKVLA